MKRIGSPKLPDVGPRGQEQMSMKYGLLCHPWGSRFEVQSDRPRICIEVEAIKYL